MNVAILIPTLGRAEALRPLLESIAKTAPPGVANIVFVLDHDDPGTHAELQDAWEQGWRFGRCFQDGTYPEKINAGLRASDDPLVLPCADDVVFHAGWYEQALAAFVPGVEVVGTNDLTPATADGQHATMPIIRRSYIEGPGAAHSETGTVFHECYHHNFVETETCKLAQHRGVYVSCPASIIEHRHPSWGTREADDTDRKGSQTNWDADEALFERRQAEWLA